jgi:hypothetical protein
MHWVQTKSPNLCDVSPQIASDAVQVAKHLLCVLEASIEGPQLCGGEAQRILSFFISSIMNPTLVSGC